MTKPDYIPGSAQAREREGVRTGIPVAGEVNIKERPIPKNFEDAEGEGIRALTEASKTTMVGLEAVVNQNKTIMEQNQMMIGLMARSLGLDIGGKNGGGQPNDGGSKNAGTPASKPPSRK